MRTTLSFIAFLIGSHIGYGQRTEFSIQAGSGLFSFYGPNSTNETRLNMDGYNYLYNPYGRKSEFSYSLAGQVQHTTKRQFIYGVQVGYEKLTSQVSVTAIVGDFGYPTPANGQGFLQNQYLNLNPFVGKRFGKEQLCLDVTIGFDAAIGLASLEVGKLSESSIFSRTTGLRRPIPDLDFRPRLTITGYYRAFGLSMGYSHGLSNYAAKQLSNDATVFSQFWRVGIAYRLGRRA